MAPFVAPFNEVSQAVAPNGLPLQAVSLCCYVGPGQVADTYNLYVKPYHQEWYVIDKADLIFQMPPEELQENGRCAVWIHANAVITKCERATAEFFVAQEVSGNDDPAGGGDGSGRRGKP